MQTNVHTNHRFVVVNTVLLKKCTITGQIKHNNIQNEINEYLIRESIQHIKHQ